MTRAEFPIMFESVKVFIRLGTSHLKTKENQIVTRYFASAPQKHNPKITLKRRLSQNQFYAVSGFMTFIP